MTWSGPDPAALSGEGLQQEGPWTNCKDVDRDVRKRLG